MIQSDPRAFLKPGDVIHVPGQAVLEAKHTEVIRLRLTKVPLPISFDNELWDVRGYPVDELERTVETTLRRAVVKAAAIRKNPLWVGKLDDPRAGRQLIMRAAFVLGDYVTLRCQPGDYGAPYKVYWNRDIRFAGSHQVKAELFFEKVTGGNGGDR